MGSEGGSQIPCVPIEARMVAVQSPSSGSLSPLSSGPCGALQLWKFSNVALAVEYIQLVHDEVAHVVMVDLIEYCW